MGQYYKGIILNENAKTVKCFIDPHSCGNGAKLMEHSYIGNNFVEAIENLIANTPQRIVWAGDYADECKQRKTNLYDRCINKKEVDAKVTDKVYKYIVNHSKKQYITKSEKCKKHNLIIHPLPLLTCEGNGRGGGDFHINISKVQGNTELIGKWSRDLISVSNDIPNDYEFVMFKLEE